VPATPPKTSVVEHEIRVGARPETVFSYFTDPAKMVQWMGAEATLDPRPGGVCRIVFQPPEEQVEFVRTAFGAREDQEAEPSDARVVLGKFVEVDPYRRISFTWGWELELFAIPPQSTEVEVSFTPGGADTVLRLAHRRLPSAAVAFHQAGWEHYLGRLAIASAGGNPGPDPWQLGADEA
jgi:uncharacterized protein YndB with AHSA1/START domain